MECAYVVTKGYLLRSLCVRVDEQDLPVLLGRQSWSLWERKTKSGRVYRYLRSGRDLLHRLIMNAPRAVVVDHVDGDGLNNSRANLRLCTHSQNMRNRRMNAGHAHGFKGVGQRKDGRYYAQIRAGTVRRFKGGFASAEAAHVAYVEFARELHGAFFNKGAPPVPERATGT